MVTEVSYSEARQHLAELWDRVLEDREAIRLTRRGSSAVVLVSAEEYDGLLETAHLLRSPTNALRLLTALRRAQAGDGEPRTVEDLQEELGVPEQS